VGALVRLGGSELRIRLLPPPLALPERFLACLQLGLQLTPPHLLLLLQPLLLQPLLPRLKIMSLQLKLKSGLLTPWAVRWRRRRRRRRLLLLLLLRLLLWDMTWRALINPLLLDTWQLLPMSASRWRSLHPTPARAEPAQLHARGSIWRLLLHHRLHRP
jgi:hypothetical protein